MSVKSKITETLLRFRSDTERLFPDSDSRRQAVFEKAVEDVLTVINEGQKMKVAYIAGPYRAGYGRTVYQNIQIAERVAVKYWRLGYAVICPHKNTAHFDGLCADETWLEGDLELLRRADVVVMMPNYQESQGACAELEEAKHLGKEVIYE